MNDKLKNIIGIDLGTTNSVMTAIDDKGKLVVLNNRDGKDKTPSFVWVKVDEDTNKVTYSVGERARKRMETDPLNVVSSYKPYIGTMKVIKEIRDTKFTAQQASAIVLRYMMQSAKQELGTSDIKAVITVPAYFNEHQKSATKMAAVKAGINVLGIIPEPTASALYYTNKEELDEDGEFVLVYDIGGGTFDVSIVHVTKEDATVQGVNGHRHLGGDDFDNALAFYIVNKSKTIKNLESLDIKGREILVRRCEEAKRTLMNLYSKDKKKNHKVVVDLSGLMNDNEEKIELTLNEFEENTKDFVERTMKVVDELIEKTDIDVELIDNVILVGGSSRLSGVRKALSKKFPKFEEDYFDKYAVDPDLAISMGATLYAEMLVNKTENSVANTLPMSLGVELNNGEFSVILNEGDLIPAVRSDNYKNSLDNQTKVEIQIYEGKSNIAKNNTKIGQIEIEIPEGYKAGDYNILVSFSMTADGTLSIKAVPETGRPKRLKIERETDTEDINVDNIEFEETEKASKSKKKLDWDN